jgi:serralysin
MPTTSLDAAGAAAQITRNLGGWVPALGTAVELTYAYRSTAPASYPLAAMNGFARASAAEIVALEDALQSWSDVANITFTRVGTGTTGEAAYSNSAGLLLGNFTGDAATVASYGGYGQRNWTTFGGVYNRTGQVWLDGTETRVTAPTITNSGYRLLIHEVGHAIGLSHPGVYDISAGPATYAANAEYIQDSYQYTLMSYFSETNTGSNFGRQQPMTPMLHDIAAAQRIYGANMTTRTGATTYGFNSNTGELAYTFTSAASERVFCIWDAGGIDTIDASLYTLRSIINLNQGAFSSMGALSGSTTTTMTNNVSIAFGAVIENAIGGFGDDVITGNAVANTLSGGDGADTLTGGAGNDILAGGTGEDTLDLSGDAARGGGNGVYVDLGGGATLDGFGTYDTLSSFERVIGTDSLYPGFAPYSDLIFGSSVANIIEGRGGNDYLEGFGGNDVIYGETGNDILSGGEGADSLIFGVGNDYVFGGNGGDAFYIQAADVRAGDYDTVVDFVAGQDYFAVSASLSGQIGVYEASPGIVLMYANAVGGAWYQQVYGTGVTAAAVTAALFYI